MSRHDLDIELRGQLVNIEFFALSPEPDVGLMGYGFEDEVITDQEGNALNWELTEAELDKVGDAVNQKMLDAEADWDDHYWGGAHE